MPNIDNYQRNRTTAGDNPKRKEASDLAVQRQKLVSKVTELDPCYVTWRSEEEGAAGVLIMTSCYSAYITLPVSPSCHTR